MIPVSPLTSLEFHKGKRNNLYFWRDHMGCDIDINIDFEDLLIPVDVKSSRTFSQSSLPILIIGEKYQAHLCSFSNLGTNIDVPFVQLHDLPAQA